jgi:alkanesulfonate monooxygenase SsuD/methylene tetrahydromethanopterin reductase-like flavin-dependent oxidoreductase (luciferase family)
MAVQGEISPAAQAQNEARARLVEELRSFYYIAGNPDEVIEKMVRALDRYVETKLVQRQY